MRTSCLFHFWEAWRRSYLVGVYKADKTVWEPCAMNNWWLFKRWLTLVVSMVMNHFVVVELCRLLVGLSLFPASGCSEVTEALHRDAHTQTSIRLQLSSQEVMGQGFKAGDRMATLSYNWTKCSLLWDLYLTMWEMVCLTIHLNYLSVVDLNVNKVLT